MTKADMTFIRDTVQAIIADGLREIASAITPTGAGDGQDAAGGCISSLTEAVMGITAGLVQVAEALSSIASAIDAHGKTTRRDRP